MPRNGAGVYILPPSNPVVPGTIIATTWANPTLSDIAQALTDSLDRNGLGGMLAPFYIADGTISAPGLAFANEHSLGIWRSSTGEYQLTSGGTNVFTIESDRVVSPVKMEHRGIETYKLTGYKSWKVDNQLGKLTFTPSATINLEDWDAAKATSFETTGALVVQTFYAYGEVTARNYNQIVYIANKTGSIVLDYNNGQSQIWTLTGPTTVTGVIDLLVGNILRLVLKNTNQGITWAAVPPLKWPGGVVPDLTTGPLKEAIVVFEYDGVNILAMSAAY